MSKKRIAIIDIGTNTFNLLIVDRTDDGFEKIFSTKEGVGLGLGGINEGKIAKDAIERGRQTLLRFFEKCETYKVEKMKAFATSAVRDAENKAEFLSLCRDELNLEIEVISGEKEAALIYKGVRQGFTFNTPSLIMDIGGGSTEFIYANQQKVVKSKSFDIGTARIFQLFKFSDPYSIEDVQKVLKYLEEKTNDFFKDVNTDRLIGASGSFETFYAILNQREYPENEFEDMKTESLNQILQEMIHSSYADREANPFIIPIRKKMAPIAAIKIKWIIDKLNIETLTISPFAMKEGVINEINA